MGIPQHLRRLVSNLSEKNYEQMVSDYRFWMKIGLTHGWTSDDELDSYIQENIKPGPHQQLIHPTSHFLLQFVTDVSFDPVSSTHTRLCHSSLYRFFADNLDFSSRSYPKDHQLSEFYTNVNFLAHWVNLGYLGVEDVRDHLLQSLTFQHSPLDYQVNSLLILLKIAGATFAAYVDPPVINHCLNIIKSKSGPHGTLIKVRRIIIRMAINNGCEEHRMSSNYRKAVGKDFLPLLSCLLQSPKSLSPSHRILRQLRLQHLSDFRPSVNSLRPLPLHPRLLVAPQMRVQDLRLPYPHRPVSPACPTSP